MNKAIHRYRSMELTPARQRGVITTFTGVLILVLLGLMMFFANGVRLGSGGDPLRRGDLFAEQLGRDLPAP